MKHIKNYSCVFIGIVRVVYVGVELDLVVF